MSDQPITSATNVVLKLQLGEDCGTRRIALRRLWDTTKSSVSYEILAGLAIKYTFPQTNGNASKYDVSVTYTDEDGDEITVSTDEDLSEAFAQFLNHKPPVLRAKATVKPVEVEVTVENMPEPETLVIETPETEEEKSEKEKPPIQNEEERAPSSPTIPEPPVNTKQTPPASKQINAILENVVGILATAVVALQGHVANANGVRHRSPFGAHAARGRCLANLTATATPRAAEEARSFSPCRDAPPKESRPSQGDAESLIREVIDKISVQEEEEKPKVPAQTADVQTPEIAAPSDVSDTNYEINALPSGFDPKFIHGRHTCDGCLSTPIIGIRYHAVNIPDYDLCHNCKGNHKSTEIMFEPVELDRDRALQHRWQRRQLRRARQARLAEGKDRNVRNCVNKVESMDADLKEAIRRSLLDSGMERADEDNKAPNVEESVVLEENNEDAKTSEDAPVKREQDVSVEVQNDDRVVPDGKALVKSEGEENMTEAKEESDIVIAKSEDSEDVEIVINEAEKIIEETEITRPEVEGPPGPPPTFARDAEGRGSIAEAIGATLDNCAQAIDAIVSEFEKEVNSQANSAAGDGNENQNNTAEKVASVVADAVEAAAVASNVASEVEAALEEQSLCKPTDDDSISVMTSSLPSVVDSLRAGDDVVVEDVVVGDVVVDDVVVEDVVVEDVVVVEDETSTVGSEPEIVEDDVISVENDIAPKEDDIFDDPIEDDEDEWAMVTEDAQIANDEMLARASHLLGSALFQSDMSRSA